MPPPEFRPQPQSATPQNGPFGDLSSHEALPRFGRQVYLCADQLLHFYGSRVLSAAQELIRVAWDPSRDKLPEGQCSADVLMDSGRPIEARILRAQHFPHVPRRDNDANARLLMALAPIRNAEDITIATLALTEANPSVVLGPLVELVRSSEWHRDDGLWVRDVALAALAARALRKEPLAGAVLSELLAEGIELPAGVAELDLSTGLPTERVRGAAAAPARPFNLGDFVIRGFLEGRFGREGVRASGVIRESDEAFEPAHRVLPQALLHTLGGKAFSAAAELTRSLLPDSPLSKKKKTSLFESTQDYALPLCDRALFAVRARAKGCSVTSFAERFDVAAPNAAIVASIGIGSLDAAACSLLEREQIDGVLHKLMEVAARPDLPIENSALAAFLIGTYEAWRDRDPMRNILNARNGGWISNMFASAATKSDNAYLMKAFACGRRGFAIEGLLGDALDEGPQGLRWEIRGANDRY